MLGLRLASANFKPQKIHPRLEGARGMSETVPSKTEWAKMTITWKAPRLSSAHFHGSPDPHCQSSGCTCAARALVVTVGVAGARVAHYAAIAEGLSITPET